MSGLNTVQNYSQLVEKSGTRRNPRSRRSLFLGVIFSILLGLTIASYIGYKQIKKDAWEVGYMQGQVDTWTDLETIAKTKGKDALWAEFDLPEAKCEPSKNQKVNGLLNKYWADLGCEKLKTFWRIAQAESGGQQVIDNRGLNRNKTIDFGWCGVNTIHRRNGESILAFEQRMYNLEENIRTCRAIYDDRASWDTNGFKAWSTFNNKKYLKFIPN